MQFCNLTTINVSDVESQKDLNERAIAAAFIGTLQAGYTDFHFLRDEWKMMTEKEALLGVSMTGITSGAIDEFNTTEAVLAILSENKRVADLIGIQPAARTTCIKPEGTSSLVLGTTAGIHAWHNDFFVRRLIVNKEEPIHKYLMATLSDLMEDSFTKPHLESILSIPMKAPKNALFRHESALNMLKRVKKYHEEWIIPGHISGDNTHNISATISIKDKEWDDVGEWMWQNKESYNGLSVLPFDGTEYVQMPLEDCSKYIYEKMCNSLKKIDLTKVIEEEDNTSLKQQAACQGGYCEVSRIGK
jgi:ribonucleoside-diphosphate reductase alpha chain